MWWTYYLETDNPFKPTGTDKDKCSLWQGGKYFGMFATRSHAEDFILGRASKNWFFRRPWCVLYSGCDDCSGVYFLERLK